MIIIDTIIKLDGSVEQREIEVPDDYFDTPPTSPTLENRLAATEAALLALLMEG
jgi:hypothetical protein